MKKFMEVLDQQVLYSINPVGELVRKYNGVISHCTCYKEVERVCSINCTAFAVHKNEVTLHCLERKLYKVSMEEM